MILLCLLLVFDVWSQTPTAASWQDAPASEWRTLFNGRNLDGWVVKLAHHEVGDNYGDTFRVEDGTIAVRYDQYGEDFGARFGHLFYTEPFSQYVLSLDYRI